MAKKSAGRDVSKSQSIKDFLAANPSLGAKGVKEGLAAKGIDVSVGLVNKIKYTKPTSGGASAPASKTGKPGKKAAKRKAAGRPQAGGSNFSSLIRDYIRQNPSATRPDVRSGLQAAGHDVKTSLVNAVFVKYYSDAGKPMPTARPGRAASAAAPPKAAVPKKRPGRKPAAASSAPAPVGGALDASSLLDAKTLVDRLGGIVKVRKALELLEKLA